MKHDLRKTLCVILHFDSELDTNNCIESLLQEERLDIVVADNDPKQSYVPPENLYDFVKLIKTGGVAGFSEGNNIAVKAFLSNRHDSVFILNNDTLVSRGAISYLRAALFDSGAGCVGPCMPYADAPDKIWACGGYIRKYRLAVGALQPRAGMPYEVDYLPGAAIFCRADVWKKIGGLCEDYFLAYEEAEFALEVKKRGFKVLVEPRSIILHKVGMSSQRRPEYYYNSVRNRLIFSKYLFGKRRGFCYGVLATSVSINFRVFEGFRQRFSLWAKAVADEKRGAALNRAALLSIASRYGSF